MGAAPGRGTSGARGRVYPNQLPWKVRAATSRTEQAHQTRRPPGGRKSSSRTARACRQLSVVLKGVRGHQRAGCCAPSAARRPLCPPDSCPVLFPAAPKPLPLPSSPLLRPCPPLSGRINSAGARPRAPGSPRVRRAPSPAATSSRRCRWTAASAPSYLLLSVAGAVPPLPVFLSLLLLLKGLRLDVFDFLQLFGRLSHGWSRCPGPRLPDPSRLARQVATASRGGTGSLCSARGELLSPPRGGCGRVGGEVAASRAEG